MEVFEHLRINPVFTVRELHRVLKRGGQLLLSTPNLFSLAGIWNFLAHQRAMSWSCNDLYDELNLVNEIGFAGHVREYTFREVGQFLLRIGFTSASTEFRLGGSNVWTRVAYKCAPWLRPNVLFIATK
jgi:predicted SAM-dependent methyltransferase